MKKSIGVYSIIWAICLAIFNVIVFVTPNEIGGVSKFSGSFWGGYIFITIAFVGQLACAFVAFKAENLKKFFYNIPLLSISYGGLVAMLIVGSIFMAIPVLPEWIGIIVCVIILAFNAIAIIKATAAADIVSGIDEKIKTQTFFIKSLIADAQSLMNSAKTNELLAETKKVYETVRYSDPMSNDKLFELDSQIRGQFTVFADAVKSEDTELAKETANALIEMVELRNQKVKLLK
mgnify:CR=1 FL=1